MSRKKNTTDRAQPGNLGQLLLEEENDPVFLFLAEDQGQMPRQPGFSLDPLERESTNPKCPRWKQSSLLMGYSQLSCILPAIDASSKSLRFSSWVNVPPKYIISTRPMLNYVYSFNRTDHCGTTGYPLVIHHGLPENPPVRSKLVLMWTSHLLRGVADWPAISHGYMVFQPPLRLLNMRRFRLALLPGVAPRCCWILFIRLIHQPNPARRYKF